ncbi:ferritin-like domain-containing protein [Falsiroseomonas tokyonensis]|uniref:Ferritin-like domain-containing protein n=1 Tax=Falsiroseomonas tokyonensis TaxID=430521 RepID=A0ABV7C129_9PROT|nr:ferritin-like domain-containing protein [Falsiroseomonas tokyonensis]MBU8540630.1 CDGSH iron-sulfur domain-containing protein [Falsiroseomonas tokyonensis]
MPDLSEPTIAVRSREELLYLLAEAAEIEHNLMCCYLFAAFGLKTAADGLTEADAAAVAGWKRAITHVAVDEMTHLALVANLTAAIGGAPHFGRPNFPVGAGYHPSGVIVQLTPFDRATLDHFIYLERPEGVSLQDGTGFASPMPDYRRETPGERIMPSAQDYLTVGHLYRSIRAALVDLAARLGETALFVGDPALQVGPDLAALKGLCRITDLASALAALDTIVEQGEGSPADIEASHYRRFLAVREAYDARLAADPAFAPSRAVVRNPVMRRPPDPAGKTYIDHPGTAPVMDLANAIYAAMLRSLVQGFAETDPVRKRLCIDASIDTMFGLVPVAEHLTSLPACMAEDGRRAGMSFAMLRDVAPLAPGAGALAVLAERYGELGARAGTMLPPALGESVATALGGIAARLMGRPAATEAPAIEVAEGRDVVISFEATRCIHARFCVLQQPAVFKANVVGAWIAPDDATTTEGLVMVAQNCPSGAIRYQRRDGGPEEAPPPVNLIQVRENGPLAVRADIHLAGEAIGYRATLCRCGASGNKPFCDGSHKAAGFAATGEPETGDTTPLPVRDGVLQVRPQRNGPLAVSGAIEMLSGTGRTILKTEAAMLCRCGQSRNKPFCDGSHAAAGFLAD